ncbi:hypothetical protein D3C78_1424330 [compost metagenome]
MAQPKRKKVGTMKPKARMFLTPAASAFFSREAPISYDRKPAWIMIIRAMHHQ